jgi:PPOX class probable F420-dependent enzyme
VVVTTFAVVGGNVVTAVDHKPKRTERLQRLVNIEANPSASLLVDYYEEDWAGLWWVRVDGPASIHRDGEQWVRAVDSLVAKYPQYQEWRPQGPVIAISLDRVTWWESTR